MHESGGRFLLIVLTLVVATCSFAQLPISELRVARGSGLQMDPIAASDGRDFLLAWTDYRSGSGELYATRISASGAVLDREGILLSTPAERVYSPSSAWTGSEWIVAWSSDSGCRFRRVAADGRLLDPAPRLLHGQSCYAPRLAVANGQALVASARPYEGVDLTLIERNGTTRSAGLVRGALSEFACTNRECLLVAQIGQRLYGRRLSFSGELLAPQEVIASNAADPALAVNGERFLLVWRDRNALWGWEPNRESFVIAEAEPDAIRDLAVTPSGNGFLVAWNQSTTYPLAPLKQRLEMRAKRVGDSYDEELTMGRSVTSDTPAIASNGTVHLGAWSRGGKVAMNFPGELTRSATAQSGARIVDCDDHLLVLWTEEVRGDGDLAVMARRFRYNGEAIDAQAIAIAPSYQTQTAPDAAFDGESYLVVWSENSGSRARVIHADGTLAAETHTLAQRGGDARVAAMDRGFAMLFTDRGKLVVQQFPSGTRTEVADAANDPDYALAWNGSALVAVWSGDRVYAARVLPSGVRVDAEPILAGFGNQRAESPSIACDASQCAIAWYEPHAGVKLSVLIGGAAYAISEPMHDFADYHTPTTDRYAPFVARHNGEFRLVARGFSGGVYERSLRNGFTSPERSINAPAGAIAYVPGGLVSVFEQAVHEPLYAGARRLFFRHEPE